MKSYVMGKCIMISKNGKKEWCVKYDIEITEDMLLPVACWEDGLDCGSCRSHVFETENEIRARKALEAGRKQPSLFSALRNCERGETESHE